MHAIRVDWNKLHQAFEERVPGTRYYFDRESGDVTLLTDEVLGYVERPPDWNLPPNITEAIDVAREIKAKRGTRYLPIPAPEGPEGREDRLAFIETLGDGELQERLWATLHGDDPLPCFDAALSERPELHAQWKAFREEQVHRRAVSWLELQDVAPRNDWSPTLLIVEDGNRMEKEELSQEKYDQLVHELTLLLLYLYSWEEQLAPDANYRRAWKGYDFNVLNALEDAGYLGQSRRAKSLSLTEKGIESAKGLLAKYHDLID